MPKIFIISKKNDYHVEKVTERLKEIGASFVICFTDESMYEQRTFHRISNKDKQFLLLKEGQDHFYLDDVDTVWLRRMPRHFRLPEGLDLKDAKFVEAENYIHLSSFWLSFGDNVRWVNPFHSRDRANGKNLQLVTAVKVGLKIPETLISNDKTAILEFVLENKPFGTIYKAFTPASWKEKDEIYSCYTTNITEDQIVDDEIISWTPGIYQKRLEKKYEIRITFLGNEYVAVKIHNEIAQDWRTLIDTDDFKISRIDLPFSVVCGCQKLMKALGIEFGCFDFIVTHDNEYFFLEVNEMGQFLWIENMLPETNLLNKFCDFLVQKH